MSTNVPHNQNDQEIDLSQISKKIGSLFQDFNAFIFNCIQFFVRNGIVIIILLIVGFGLGFYLDISKKTYNHQIIVAPNFKSTDYLYGKIDLIQSKIAENDTVFLKDVVGIAKPKEVLKIEIKPINDVYDFIENKPSNFELIKLITEDSDIKNALEDNMTSKNYKNHKIVINTNELISEESTIQPIINFLNESDYFKKVQKVEVNNAEKKLRQNDTIISQIDAVLNGVSNSVNSNRQSDKLVYYNENTQLNDIIKTKEALILQQGILRVDMIGMDKIIKQKSASINIKKKSLLVGKIKLILPFVLIIGFVFLVLFNRFYKNQKELSATNA